MKKAFCALLALLMGLGCFAKAASAELPEDFGLESVIEYQGGVVRRGNINDSGIALAIDWSELDVAYVKCDASYLVKDVPVTWTVTAIGGSGQYEYEFGLYHREGKSGNLTICAMQKKSSSTVFTCTPQYSTGQYALEVQLYDSTGAYLTWQSPIFEAAKASDQNDVSTVPGKVAYLAQQCLSQAGESEFGRALWLHDWLTNNADYDTSYTYFYPEGVLLYGTGVCDSYALAYRMLLDAVGIENLYISGQALSDAETNEWENHAWNLVKLNGQWYHVDCTWDDPTGGSENHAYFALTDAQISRDHAWTHNNGLLPECTSTDIVFSDVVYIANTETAEEGLAKLTSAVSRAEEGLYLVFSTVAAAEDFDEQAIRSLADLMFAGTLTNAKCVSNWELFLEEDNVSWYTFISGNTSEARVRDVRLNYGSGYQESDKVRYACFLSENVSLAVGEETKLSLFCVPQNGTGLTWKTSNAQIASVDSGKVTGRAPGKAVITATLPGGETIDCAVYVMSGQMCVIGGDVRVIEGEAFLGCTGIQTLVLESGVTSIGERAFSGCTGLLTAQIPASVASIAANAFEGCPNLEIVCPAGTPAAAFAQAQGIRWREP